jgi:hypothetical protein
VIAWAHPTSGVVEACAPSLMPDNAGLIWGLADILAKGYVVVATVSHTFAAKDSVGQALAWMGDRFRGAPAPTECRH